MSACSICKLAAAVLVAAGLGCLGSPAAHAGDHPSLLITPADLLRLRHACGVGQPAVAAEAAGKFGRHAADFQALRQHLAKPVPGEPLPGELIAAAFLHLVDPGDKSDPLRLKTIEAALQDPDWVTMDPLEMVLALDWCWNDLSPTARREFMLAIREHAEPLAAADSPLETRHFRDKLTALALALAVDEVDDSNPSWLALRTRLLSAGHKYFTTTFPVYVRWRGLSPTGPALAAREECDTALAVELAGRLLERDLWAEQRATVGRWLEHYVLATMDHPALQHNFIRDDGSHSPLLPVPAWQELLPLTAHLIAARTGDPAAALVARDVAAAARDPATILAWPWRWVPIVLDTDEVTCCDRSRLPVARNLGGAVVFRSPPGPEATTIWIDAGQPFLRRRQHFDAGHFLIYRGGHLAVDGGDDITFEAVPSKGGFQGLGTRPEPFDFEQYFTATIAHNCLVCWDAAWVLHWYGKLYQPTGGQRCIEGSCTDFETPLAAQGRETGRQLAYGHYQSVAYLALDLAPAYESRALAEYTREFVFLSGRVLVVIDRIARTRSRSAPTWIINLPARPLVDGQKLPAEARVAGETNEAGVWRCDDATWLRWADRDGSLWLNAPLPVSKCLRVVGGPASKALLKDDPQTHRTYVGGEANGFERLIIPAEQRGALNAWYRLGTPTLLGPQFGHASHWGRIEIEPAEREPETMFVTVLITDRADATLPPTVELRTADATHVLSLKVGEQSATLRLGTGMQRGGSVEVSGTETLFWKFPTEVVPDQPLD